MESLSVVGEKSVLPQADLIFKDEGGKLKFVGDFEKLYQTERDPWGQSGGPSHLQDYYYSSRRRLISTLHPYVSKTPGFRGLEVGCGHGHVVDLLCNSTCSSMTKCWKGMDVSPTAIKRAQELYPELMFTVGDITDPYFSFQRPQFAQDLDCILLGQMWWYILDALSGTLWNCWQMLNARPGGGLLVISQAFLEKQRYGVLQADGFEGALNIFMSPPMRAKWRLLDAHRDEPDGTGYCYDGLIVLRAING